MSAAASFDMAARLLAHDATCATCGGVVRGIRTRRCMAGYRLANAVREADRRERQREQPRLPGFNEVPR